MRSGRVEERVDGGRARGVTVASFQHRRDGRRAHRGCVVPPRGRRRGAVDARVQQLLAVARVVAREDVRRVGPFISEIGGETQHGVVVFSERPRKRRERDRRRERAHGREAPARQVRARREVAPGARDGRPRAAPRARGPAAVVVVVRLVRLAVREARLDLVRLEVLHLAPQVAVLEPQPEERRGPACRSRLESSKFRRLASPPNLRVSGRGAAATRLRRTSASRAAAPPRLVSAESPRLRPRRYRAADLSKHSERISSNTRAVPSDPRSELFLSIVGAPSIIVRVVRSCPRNIRVAPRGVAAIRPKEPRV